MRLKPRFGRQSNGWLEGNLEVCEQKNCELCGRPARVRTLIGYREGAPLMRIFCLGCADTVPARGFAGGTTDRTRVAMRNFLVAAGIFVMLVGALGDHLGIHASPGFGWYQRAGLVLGTLLLACGALLRIDLMALVGAMVFALSAGADWLGIAGSDGFGWKQDGAILGGFLIALVGLALERRARHAAG